MVDLGNGHAKEKNGLLKQIEMLNIKIDQYIKEMMAMEDGQKQGKDLWLVTEIEYKSQIEQGLAEFNALQESYNQLISQIEGYKQEIQRQREEMIKMKSDWSELEQKYLDRMATQSNDLKLLKENYVLEKANAGKIQKEHSIQIKSL